MLEQPHLLMPQLTRESEALLRASRESSPLGLARWVPAHQFLGRATLEVREYEETPLVFTVRRAWTFLRRYEVEDAEELSVGAVQWNALLAPSGCEVAWRIVEGERVRFYLLGGGILATQTSEGDFRRVDFGPDKGSRNPFLRMLVLAGVMLL